ncbi:MAG: 16S rRNA (guanine(966)-N(2))-methyltransferase RsmD [Candidatus Nitrotoga sp.]|nr:16S rRNA (guanine(966)-N(2))-methyltransferase RsmD [Candidatus Nitrotoga sp.]MDO9448182.1 16S rRNA (guanine(966)-N(2))-methyltransferase RsmD [Candidatus Nitrotoga sp.]
MNRVRIIGGTHRSRWVGFPDAEGLRPTPDRVRETLFNWLGQNLNGRRCLDLFAGSGILGLEAASRGAAEVVMVERNRTVFRALQETLIKLACSNVLLRCEDGLEFARQKNGLFDVIFLDPPFQSDYLPKLLPLLADKLTQDGLVYVESGAVFEPDKDWQVLKRAKAGAVHYQLLSRENTLTV